jgi:hypothetical protein
MSPIALSDEQLTAVLAAAAPLRPDDRSVFLEAVAMALQGREVEDAISEARKTARGRRRLGLAGDSPAKSWVDAVQTNEICTLEPSAAPEFFRCATDVL